MRLFVHRRLGGVCPRAALFQSRFAVALSVAFFRLRFQTEGALQDEMGLETTRSRYLKSRRSSAARLGHVIRMKRIAAIKTMKDLHHHAGLIQNSGVTR